MADCVAPVEKFRDYIFRPGATHGKDRVFLALGYDRDDSERLAHLYAGQAAAKYASQDYSLGSRDEHGQRINIEIELKSTRLTSEGSFVHETSYLVSGWMVQPDGGIRLNTPFSGFSREKRSGTVTP